MVQLFKEGKKVPLELINRICLCFGFEDINDKNNEFSLNSLKYHKTYEKINELKGELEPYYKRCKSHYLDFERKITNKKEYTDKEIKCMILLKQLLSDNGKSLIRREISKEIFYYSIIEKKNTKSINIMKSEGIIDFN